MDSVIHRPIDFEKDREYLLECHCRINYECDTPWARKVPYQEYRNQWFSWSEQTEGFYNDLRKSAEDPRTIAEILETPRGEKIGYLWAPFWEDEEAGFACAEIQDIFVEECFRRAGVAVQLYQYVEEAARKNGAQVIRAGTGCENTASISLHKKLGFYTYRYEFEKEL